MSEARARFTWLRRGTSSGRGGWLAGVLTGTVGFAGLVGLVGLAGCQALPPTNERPDANRQAASGCPQAPSAADALTLVVLDWDGGANMLVRDALLGPFRASELTFVGDTLSDAELHQAVIERVQAMLCVLRPLDVAVIEGDADAYPYDTVVHITGDAPAIKGRHIGQSTFDPCNEYDDDAVVIWGGALIDRIPPSSADAWVAVFANSIAHEIGHTLGFFHPDDRELALLEDPGREVMRARVAPLELVQEQAFVIRQETCPGMAPGLGSYNVIDGVGCGSVGSESECPALTIGDTRAVELR